METQEVKIARLEEGMVTVKGDTKYIRQKMDALLESHWTLSGKMLGLSGLVSVLVALVTTIVTKAMIK